jgi:hypothetical protein
VKGEREAVSLEPPRDRPADPCVGAGDECHLIHGASLGALTEALRERLQAPVADEL